MIIYCDGGSRGNPGNSASAFVVVDNNNSSIDSNVSPNEKEDYKVIHGENSIRSQKVIYKESKFLGINTNNIAEYSAVKMAIDWLIKNSVKEEVTINLDSQLVERQLNGFYRVKDLKLKEIYDVVKIEIQKNNLKIKFIWGYRDKNEIADQLVNEELDKHSLK